MSDGRYYFRWMMRISNNFVVQVTNKICEELLPHENLESLHSSSSLSFVVHHWPKPPLMLLFRGQLSFQAFLQIKLAKHRGYLAKHMYVKSWSYSSLQLHNMVDSSWVTIPCANSGEWATFFDVHVIRNTRLHCRYRWFMICQLTMTDASHRVPDE